ncbi:MAG TPA: DUF6527 family protein [Candidatus Paceibacterota bacterium]
MKIQLLHNSYEKKLYFYCEACDDLHHIVYERIGDHFDPYIWVWNKSYSQPTISPSILVMTPDSRCHLFVKRGQLEYLQDCSHHLRGKITPMHHIPSWLEITNVVL